MSDADARSDAVEPGRSVIVQAPAGSGKTTLLVERYLGLLGVVEAPEEILAITFTRKAAAEMRARVLRYLRPDFDATEPHEQAALAKARAIRDKVAAWRLRDNPQRLLIRTIDSFNLYLARTMPVASALGPVPAPADNTKALYREAARRVLASIDTNDDIAPHVERLLDWRDHRSQDVENVLAALLGRRDQWLRALQLTGEPDRAAFEALLQQVVSAQLARASEELQASAVDEGELVELLQFAARTLEENERASPIRQLRNLKSLPDADPAALPLWAGLAEALLTRDGSFRRQVNVAIGFPPRTDEKTHFESILERIADDEALRESLHRTRSLPQPRYDDADWQVLDSLVRVLRHTARELAVVFAETGQSDYTGLAAAALQGLGDEETGFTDLGLYLDRRIRHLLVDEFQDTNWLQLHLLEKLTAGWEPGDGRTLFLVGDPMQSIYRFREAEVGLFIRSRDQGVGTLTLESRQLTRNFRSRSEIVDWVNGQLGPIFPTTENISAGAVAYARSDAGRGAGGRVDVIAHPSDADEAESIARLVARAISDHAADSAFKAAIIVRARSHLKEILPALRRHQVTYRAVKLDPLTSRPVVQDLLALTRAILQPADTAAVLAVLRSPVCGLTLADLHALAGDGRSLHDPRALDRLTEHARERAQRAVAVLYAAQETWRRRSVRDLVEGAWHALGGPACCVNPATDLRDAGVYLDALDLAAGNGLLEDWNDFVELLDGEHTEGDPPSEHVKLEILTMHGAKGLEWDLVILPALNKRPRGRDSELLHWLPFTTDDGEEQVLLAPLRSAEKEQNSALVELIRAEQKTRADYENQRLLYVASTRAREHLVLSATLTPNTKGDIEPASGSLLADLWPKTAKAFTAALENRTPGVRLSPLSTPGTGAAAYDQGLRRVDAFWRPHRGEAFRWKHTLPPRERDVDVEYNWAGTQARRTGTVLHRLLERVGRIGIEALDAAERARLLDRIPRLLAELGTRADLLAPAVAIVRDAFQRTLESERGRWILSNRHTDAACELAIAGLIDGALVTAIVDRTFVDERGERWIIDYKSGYHAGADLDAFFAQERERYAEQLSSYRKLFEQLERRPVRTALYLPRHGRLEETPAS